MEKHGNISPIYHKDIKNELYQGLRMLKRITNNLIKPHKIPVKIMLKFHLNLSNYILNKKTKVKYNKKPIFTMRNFNSKTNMRIISFEDKEPETLNWINQFKKEDNLLDVGANVGVYSLYAAFKGYKVASIEPDALNFALLNINIHDNKFNDRIVAYPYSIHSASKLSILNIPSYNWGDTASSFDRRLDWKGDEGYFSFRQGSPGISIDDFVGQSGFFPNHIKVDVDGNEYLVLSGAKNTLKNKNCRSILVEMYESHPEYGQCLILLESGFELTEKTHTPWSVQPENHIFIKS